MEMGAVGRSELHFGENQQDLLTDRMWGVKGRGKLRMTQSCFVFVILVCASLR